MNIGSHEIYPTKQLIDHIINGNNVITIKLRLLGGGSADKSKEYRTKENLKWKKKTKTEYKINIEEHNAIDNWDILLEEYEKTHENL